MRKVFRTVCLATSTLILLNCSSADKVAERAPAGSSFDPSTQSTTPATVNETNGYIFDGGQLVEGREDTNILSMGGKNGIYITEEKFVSLDREKHAPVGKMLYVLTDETPSRCIKAQFTNFKQKKVLLAYPKSAVPSSYCVYQKSFNPEGHGFSVYLKSGPTCKPSYFSTTEDSQKRKIASIQEVSHPISFSYCVDATLSFGEHSVAAKK